MMIHCEEQLFLLNFRIQEIWSNPNDIQFTLILLLDAFFSQVWEFRLYGTNKMNFPVHRTTFGWNYDVPNICIDEIWTFKGIQIMKMKENSSKVLGISLCMKMLYFESIVLRMSTNSVYSTRVCFCTENLFNVYCFLNRTSSVSWNNK